MIAVVYSGSRFADWRLANKGMIITGFKTMGINPNLHDDRFILQTLNKSNNLINYAEAIRKIYFFGAGTSSPERKEKISRTFEQFFKFARIYIDQDIMGSALSTLGDNRGIIGVLGSGSNAGYYNGRKIIEDNYGLGYILADEGSSNWIGRQLLRGFLTETMPDDLRDIFIGKYPTLDRKQILERVYNLANPNLFLTSFSDFIEENQSHPYIQDILREGFALFIDTYIIPLMNKHPNFPVNIVGTVAAAHEKDLRLVAKQKHIHIDQIVKEPIHNLVNYYMSKN